jgi:hypothetical protein
MTDIIINDLRPRTQITQTTELLGTNRYDFGFPILSKADLKVAIDDTVIDQAEYSVFGEGSATGGYIEFNTVAPSVGSRITLWRDMPFERTTDFAPGADLRASVLNDELDRTALLLQQAEALVGDSLHRRPYDLDQELVLPTVAERAGKYLSFDENGVPEAINSRVLGEIGNLALVYQGPVAAPPTLRLDGTPLRDGDLYFDTTIGRLRARSDGAWVDTTTLVPSAFMASLLDADSAGAARDTLGLGSAAVLEAGTAGDALVRLDSLGRLPAVDGSLLTGLSAADFAARDLATMNAWEIARLSGLTTAGYVNTYLDIFTDQSGIASVAGATYDAAGDRYINPATVGTTDIVPVMTDNTTPSGTVYGSISGSHQTETDLYRLFDGSISTVEAQTLVAVYNFGAPRSIGGYSVEVFGEGQSRYPTAWSVSGSNDGASWTVLDTRSGQSWYDGERRVFETAVSGSYQYLSFELSAYTGLFAQIREIEYFEALPRPDMTIESNSVTCGAIPTELRALLDIESLEPVTENVDVTVEVSRNGGAEYDIGTLACVSGKADGGIGRSVWAATVDVGGQVDGTAARLRVKSLNNKGVVLHRWALQSDTTLSL